LDGKDEMMIEILMRMRKLLANEDNWTKEMYARDSFGVPIFVNNAKATQFCLMGALFLSNHMLNIKCSKAMRMKTKDEVIQYLAAIGHLPFGDLVRWNDDEERTHAQVLSLLDAAITNLQPTIKPVVVEEMERELETV
jgi:hypothetical protein